MSVLEFTYLRPTLGRGNGRYGAYPNTANDLQWQFVKMSASQASPERSPARGSSICEATSARAPNSFRGMLSSSRNAAVVFSVKISALDLCRDLPRGISVWFASLF